MSIRGLGRVVNGRVEVRLELPLVADSEPPGLPPGQPAENKPAGDGRGDRATHAPGFESVNWFGTTYTFSRKQRVVVACLWQAWEQGYEWVDQAGLLEEAESESRKLRDLFDQGRHPAWGTLIRKASVDGGPPGSYRLAPPDAA